MLDSEIEQFVQQRLEQELARQHMKETEKDLDIAYSCAGFAWLASLVALFVWLVGWVAGWWASNGSAESWQGGATILSAVAASLALNHSFSEQSIRNRRRVAEPMPTGKNYMRHLERATMWSQGWVLSTVAILAWWGGWNDLGRPDTWHDLLESGGIILTGMLMLAASVYSQRAARRA